MKRYTYEYVKSEIEKVEGYKLLSTEYVNARTKIKIKHDVKECGLEYEATFFGFSAQQNRCPNCGYCARLKYEHVKSKIESIEGYKLLSTKYINNWSKLKVKHDVEECGYVYEVSYQGIVDKHARCSRCFGGRKYENDYVKIMVEKFTFGEYSLLSEYTNCNNGIQIRHNKCGSVYWMRFSKFIRIDDKCPICTPEIKKEINI